MLDAMGNKKQPSKESNDALIAMMMGVGINTPSPPGAKSQLSKEAVDKCVAAINVAIVIPADDQPKCIICTKVVASCYANDVPYNSSTGEKVCARLLHPLHVGS